MEKKKHELAVIERWDISKKQTGGGGAAVLLDLTQDICHLYYGTTEPSLLKVFMQHTPNISINWSLLKGSGRLFDAEQLNDTQRVISETTHGLQASLVLEVFWEF